MQLSQENYAVVKNVLGVLELTAEEQTEKLAAFEQELLNRFAEAVAKKLPPQERAGIVVLANAAGDQDKKKELEKNLNNWFNAQEVQKLFSKTVEDFFAEFLRTAYRTASEEQKKKLGELFKPEILIA